MSAPPAELAALGGGGGARGPRCVTTGDAQPAASFGFNSLARGAPARAGGAELPAGPRGGERSMLEAAAAEAAAAAAAAPPRAPGAARAAAPAWNRERDMAVALAPSAPRVADVRQLGASAGAALASRFHSAAE
jgi:hypothetical protein